MIISYKLNKKRNENWHKNFSILLMGCRNVAHARKNNGGAFSINAKAREHTHTQEAAVQNAR